MSGSMPAHRDRLIGLLTCAAEGKGSELLKLAAEYAKYPLEGGGPLDVSSVLREYREGHGRTVAHFAANHGNVDVLRALLREHSGLFSIGDSEGQTPLHLGVLGRREAGVTAMLRAGVAVDTPRADGDTALHLACRVGAVEAAKALLEHGATPESIGKVGSALHVAALEGEEEVVGLMVAREGGGEGEEGGAGGGGGGKGGEGEKGGLLELKTEQGMTAALLAAAAHRAKAFLRLVEAGADVGAVGVHGLTAAHFWAEIGASEIVAKILEQGGEEAVVGRNGDGVLPIQLAAGKGHAETVSILWEVSKGLEGVGEDRAAFEAREVERERKEEEERVKGSGGGEGEGGGGVEEGEEELGEVGVEGVGKEEEEKAAVLREEGNALVKASKWGEAEETYTAALSLNPADAKLYSNRSLARLQLHNPVDALRDARMAAKLNPDWPKAHYRVGCACAALKRWEKAAMAFGEAFHLDQTNQQVKAKLKHAVANARAQRAAKK